MGRRLMTLSDLHNYYSSLGKNQTFSCDNDCDSIVVQVDGKLNFAKKDNTEGLFPVDLQLCFVGDNLNGSRITKESMEKALASTKYRPILGYMYEDEDGNPQFAGHNMHMENGEVVYDEIPIGVMTEEATLKYDKDNEKDYAFSCGYIFEEYTKAKEILEREEKCDVSVELSIRELSFDAKDNILVLDDFFFSGVTILGYNENTGDKVNPAMPGSNITLADFSAKDHSIVYSDKLLQALDKINETLSKFEINSTRKEEATLENNKVENFEEEIKKVSDDDVVVEEVEEVETNVEESEDETSATALVEPEEDVQEDETSESDDNTSDESESESESENDATFSVTITKGEDVKQFSVSMNEKIEALSTLVNDTYSDDMTWYHVEVYDDDKQVIMIDYWSNKAYRQSYKVKDNVFSLKGDRVEVFSTWMTADEQKAFESMKANYEDISAKLAKHEAEPEKMNILESEEYSSIRDKEEFAELKKKDNHFDLSIDELKAKADDIILSYAKRGQLNFSVTEDEPKAVGMKKLPASAKPTKRSRYGGLGRKED